jgi:transcriptional regulator with PAS, ATPase and Fis domain
MGKNMHTESKGILVLDSEGNRLYATGMAKEKTVCTILSRKWLSREGKELPRVFTTVCGASSLTAFCFSTDESVCFILARHEHDDPLVDFVASVDFAEDIFRHFITSPYEAMVVVDANARIRYLSPVHERFFGLRNGEAIGRHVTEVIENTRMHEVVRIGKAEYGDNQVMHGVTRVVSRTPIYDRDDRRVGAIGQLMYKGPENGADTVGPKKESVPSSPRSCDDTSLDRIVGSSNAIRQLKDALRKVAPLNVPVLLTGESGTGKELAAQALHSLSTRQAHPLVLVNAAAMPSTLVESELFGYDGGAFTGAERKGRKGKFEMADGGTLFLDEIGDMPADVQVKLLRVLQDGTFERLGCERPKKSNFRLVSASNRDFRSMIADGSFRLDLFYRISPVTIRLPALRERLDDIPLLVDAFLTDFSRRYGVRKKTLQGGVMQYLQSLPWPGNVRQLQHAVDRAAIFSDHDVITSADFGVLIDEMASFNDAGTAAQAPAARAAKGQVEVELIREAMQRHCGNKKRVAQELGISRSHLYKKLGALNVD